MTIMIRKLVHPVLWLALLCATSTASAAGRETDRFEALILDVFFTLSEHAEVDSGQCAEAAFSPLCRHEMGRRNLERAFSEMDAWRVSYGEDSSLPFSGWPALVDELRHFPRTEAVDAARQEIYLNGFDRFPVASVSCQNLVNRFMAAEIAVLDAAAGHDASLRHKQYEEYIQATCRPFVRLRNRLIDRHGGNRVYESLADVPQRRGAWRAYMNVYNVSRR
ncbi:hypothetical protein [Isoalcanivorax indicus]|uniref:hypothetical protein n=1 Tax=Isoalcanivorax indicus TaxID=2202653 RepID=UPI000DBA076F|nr:hypothetical protein [Isoalcanivorax indicus]